MADRTGALLLFAPFLLQQLTGVTKLNLYGCKRLSDAGITPLQGLPLLALSLGQTRIRDEGLCRIAALTRLTELHLVKEEMRENALRVLSSLSSLEVLSLRDMKLTNQSVAVSGCGRDCLVLPVQQQPAKVAG